MRHRWKWISALIIAAVLGVGLRLRQRSSPPAPEPIATGAPAPTSVPLVAQWPAGFPTAGRRGPLQDDHSDEIEVCGVGNVKLDRDDPAATGKYLDAMTQKSRLRWLAALRSSDDYRARATGLYLEGIFDRDSPHQDPEAALDELVQLALTTKDPAVMALAYTKCARGVEDLASQGACSQLSLDDWTRADADNAAAWLQLAAKAHREQDSAAEASAFKQAAEAHRYESYNWALFSFAQSAIPNDATAAERWILTADVIGVEAAMPMPYLPLFQYCSRDTPSESIHQQCGALAELMVNKATTLLDLSVGKSLGARLGWPSERVAKLTQELAASMQAINEMTGTDPKQQWSCDGVARGNAYMSQLQQFGERDLARQAIERSGETVAELSRKYEEQMAATMREIQKSEQSPAPQP